MTQVLVDVEFLVDASGALSGCKKSAMDFEKEVNRIIDLRLSQFPVPSSPQPTPADAKTLAW